MAKTTNKAKAPADDLARRKASAAMKTAQANFERLDAIADFLESLDGLTSDQAEKRDAAVAACRVG